MEKKVFPLYASRIMSLKMLLVMKLTVVLLLAGCLQVSAKAYSQDDVKLNLDLTNAKLKKVFEIIEKKSHYRFLYNSNTIKDNIRIDIHEKNIALSDVLDKVIRGNGLIYKVINNKVIAVTSASEMLQTIHVKGDVTDSTGRPLQGVTITVHGLKRGTQTDAQGHFELDVPDNATLDISSIGYQPQQVRVSGAEPVHIVLKEATSGLNQVVVVGYGTRLKEADLTGAVARISGDKLENRPVTGTLDALQGMVPGMGITRQSGQPGQQGFALSIR